MNIEQLLLIQLMEEAAEVQKRCSKALRFTLKERQIENTVEEGGSNISNADRLSHELTDLVAVADILMINDSIPSFGDLRDKLNKRDKVKEFLEYSRKIGVLTSDEEIL